MDTAFHKAIKKILPAQQILTDEAERLTYGYDNSRRHALPDMVVLPHTEQQVADIVKACHDFKVPLTARGRGTGTTGATVPVRGGLVMSFEQMNKIINMDAANRMITVEPGVTNQQVQQAAAEHGFFWAPDPTSAAFCTVGGNLAYNSAGPRAVKYGSCRENTLGLRAVTGTGEIIRCGTHTTKGVVGYDLTRLIIGSEGTLAIITQATLKLLPKAESKYTLKFTYNSMDAAARAVSSIMAQPDTPCALEFMDSRALQLIRENGADISADAAALLMVEVEGRGSALQQACDAVIQAARVEGHLHTEQARNAEEAAQIWQARKQLSPSLRKIAPKKINEDVVVPVSHIPALINGLNQLSDQYHIPIVNFGHAGNGNIHVNLLINPDDKMQMASAQECLNQVFDLVIKLDGSLSGEHGVGLEKRDFIYKELGEAEIRLMHAIKKQFDPHNILNADKTLPAL